MQHSPTRLRYLSMTEVAAIYDVSKYTIRRRIADGTLPAERVGRQLRIREDHVAQLGRLVPAGSGR